MEEPIDFPPNYTAPPCLIQPPQMWGGEQFPNVNKGEDELREPPQGNEGTGPATPKDDDKPLVAYPPRDAVRLRKHQPINGGGV